jgi:hypothetical protein
MMLAQTMVEEPKYGARSRDAAISVARVPAPPRYTGFGRSTNSHSRLKRPATVAASALTPSVSVA